MTPLIEIPNYVAISKNFAQELQLASQGKKTSLPFVKNILPTHPLIQPNQIFQTLVIGGTHGKIATVISGENKSFTILDEKYFNPLPQFSTEADLLVFIKNLLDTRTQILAINFAYNLIPITGEHGGLDGLMNQGNTKGDAFAGLLHKQVGKTVHDYLKINTGRDIVTTVANDTICLITAGLHTYTDRQNLIAAIAGTGYNLALFLDTNTVVNIQASDFSGFSQTESGKIVDEQSNNPGEQLYNKEVAAGDLYKHFNILIPRLNLQTLPLTSSEELSAVAQNGTERESQVANELLERSARLIAAQLAGIYEFKHRPEKLTCIIQGSLFLKEPDYLPTIQKQLETLGVAKDALQFRHTDNNGILGAIKLVMG